MKKIFIVSLIVLLLAACGKKEETTVVTKNDEEKQEVVKEEEKEAVSPTGDETEYNQVVVDNENIKATIVDVEKNKDDFMGETFKVKLQLVNKRSEAIMFGAEEVKADGKDISDIAGMGQEVGPRETVEGNVTVVDLETGKIPDIKEVIEFKLVAFSFDSDFEEIHDVTFNLKK